MAVTEAGIATEVNPDPKNALEPMVVTEGGITIDVRLEQLEKVLAWIIEIDFGITIDVTPELANADSPMETTDSGRSIDFNKGQPRKACDPIEVNDFGSTAETRL